MTLTFGLDGVTIGGKKPIVWYGTSIEQGGVASRPGSTYTNVLTRSLDQMVSATDSLCNHNLCIHLDQHSYYVVAFVPSAKETCPHKVGFHSQVLNFGFAGNGVMETTVAQFLVQLDPALFVIDCLPNMDASTVNERTAALVKYIRKVHPSTPILLVAGTTYGDHWINPQSNDLKRAALQTQYAALVKGGVQGLHLMLDEKNELFAFNDLVNPTVGGTHPSDLGHREIATFYSKYLPSLLAGALP